MSMSILVGTPIMQHLIPVLSGGHATAPLKMVIGRVKTHIGQRKLDQKPKVLVEQPSVAQMCLEFCDWLIRSEDIVETSYIAVSHLFFSPKRRTTLLI